VRSVRARPLSSGPCQHRSGAACSQSGRRGRYASHQQLRRVGTGTRLQAGAAREFRRADCKAQVGAIMRELHSSNLPCMPAEEQPTACRGRTHQMQMWQRAPEQDAWIASRPLFIRAQGGRAWLSSAFTSSSPTKPNVDLCYDDGAALTPLSDLHRRFTYIALGVLPAPPLSPRGSSSHPN
jgi:hypothetical protein